MTKARVNADNASADIQGVTAGTGLQGGGTSGTVTLDVDTTTIQARVANVTDTEIGYLDGVSSAIQTQLNGKINNTLTTTTGDIIYASGANTPARLGIGTTGQVLNVSGGIPAWSTPAGNTENFALISSTSMSGAASITVSGISNKNNLVINLQGVSSASANSRFRFQLNSDTGSNYYWFGFIYNDGGSITADQGWPTTSTRIGDMGNNASNNVQGTINIQGAAGTGRKPFQLLTYANGGGGNMSFWSSGYYQGGSAISSITLISGSGNFDAGTLEIYGG